MLTDYITALYVAITTGNKKEQTKIFNDLRKLGMDRGTAIMLALETAKDC